MVGLRGRRNARRAPEAGDAVARLTAKHPLRAHVDRGVGVELEGEELGLVGGAGAWQLERRRDCRGGLLAVGSQGPEELHGG